MPTATLRQLSQAVEQSPESIVITNLLGEIEYVNESFLERSGYTRAEVIGRNPRMLHSGRTPPSTYRALWDALTRGETWRGLFYNRRKDGSDYVEFAIISALREGDGRVTHYVAVQEDVTEKKRMGEELDRHRHHLQELTTSQTAELKLALRAAESANRAKTAFLANMSHEIRTPLNAIIGLTYLLRQSRMSPEQGKRLDTIDSAAQHLLSSINSILDLTKIEAGLVELEHNDFALDSVVAHVHDLVAAEARAKGLALEIDTGGTPQSLRGDVTGLRQALLNLVGNAVKFTDRGTVRIGARVLRDDDEHLLIRFDVRDTGIGIPAGELSTLFEPFTQADPSTSRKYGGSGLGLAITRHLARLMQGDAGASSAPGQGSTFWFTALLERGHAESIAHPKARAVDAEVRLRTDHQGAKLLLAEDNPVNREVALELLSWVGLSVDTAENGRVAVDKVRRGAYDLVLMDVQMPEMDGLDATRTLRADPAFSSLPILAMTANAFEEDYRLCLAAGMNDFVAKPVIPEALYATVLQWLSHSRAVDIPAPTAEAASPPSPPSPPSTPDPALGQVESGLPGHDVARAFADIPGLDAERGLSMVRGKPDRYLRLLHLFVSSHESDAANLGRLLAGGDTKAMLRLTHGLRGSSSMLGAVRLSALVTELEGALARGSTGDDCVALTSACERELTRLIEALRRLPEKLPMLPGLTSP